MERRNYLGGRASSFLHPGVGEVIDNCQHVLFGCCTNLLEFYRRIGVENRIHWTDEMTFIEPGGRRSTLGPSWLPAPMHGLPGFLAAAAFSPSDKLALARAFGALARGVPPDSRETLGGWLARHKQTPGALNRFWRLVIASALNADLDSIALPYAAKVIRELFLNSAKAGRMGMSAVPLGELYARARQFLRDRGCELLFNARVESATWDARLEQWTAKVVGGGAMSAGSLVLALPFEAMAKLLPGMPASTGAERLSHLVAQHAHWPICSVHLWFDRQITDLPHAVLLDREIHWVYNKTKLQPERAGSGQYLELVVSAARQFAALSREDAVAQGVRELAEFFPEVRNAKLQKSVFIKEIKATFAVPPGIDAARPSSASPWPNCVLAGDWTATGWPSTMESAARSGHLAAQALCAAAGMPRRFLAPDLKPTGFMRFVPAR